MSTNLEVAFSFSQPGEGWAHSALGSRLRCLLICEVDRGYLEQAGQLHNAVLHPSAAAGAAAAAAAGGRSGPAADLPPTYLLVKSKAAVRISHIVIWNDQPAMQGQKSGSRINWCGVLVVLYVALMLLLGVSRKASGHWNGW
jgi:poly[ADP-ribose] polymerase 16